jgi:hypothetical protein
MASHDALRLYLLIAINLKKSVDKKDNKTQNNTNVKITESRQQNTTRRRA